MTMIEADHLTDAGPSGPCEDMTMETSGITLQNFKQRLSGTLLGFADLAVAGMVILNVKIFLKRDTGQCWISPPSEKVDGRDGEPVYRDLVEWPKSTQRHLSSMVHDQILALAGLPPRTVGEDVGRKLEQAKQAQLPVAPSGTVTRPPRPRGEAHERAYAESRAASADPAGADIPY